MYGELFKGRALSVAKLIETQVSESLTVGNISISTSNVLYTEFSNCYGFFFIVGKILLANLKHELP